MLYEMKGKLHNIYEMKNLKDDKNVLYFWILLWNKYISDNLKHISSLQQY